MTSLRPRLKELNDNPYISYAGHDAKVLRAVALLPWYCESTKAFVWGKRQEVIFQIEECSSLYIENSPYHLNTFL